MHSISRTLFVAMIIYVESESDDYFSYNDCDYKCISLNESCTISEVNGNFLNLCYTSALKCETMATVWMVCLRPDQPPIGGESIWTEYKQRHKPTTTTEPTPTESDNCNVWKITLSLIITVPSISAVITLIVLRIKRRNEYSTFSTPTDDNPYQNTVTSNN